MITRITSRSFQADMGFFHLHTHHIQRNLPLRTLLLAMQRPLIRKTAQAVVHMHRAHPKLRAQLTQTHHQMQQYGGVNATTVGNQYAVVLSDTRGGLRQNWVTVHKVLKVIDPDRQRR